MSVVRGFWSYAHDDDIGSKGRISDLARDLKEEYELITGDEIELFLDRDSLVWGDAWRQTIDRSLSAAAFFIPVITPRFFQRPECLREYRLFTSQAEQLGVTALILPVLWADFPALYEDADESRPETDVSKYQWVDWTALRHESRTDPNYSRTVGEMAKRIQSANIEVDRIDFAQVAERSEQSNPEVEDEPGQLDNLADMEAAIPEWIDKMDSFGEHLKSLGSKAEKATAELNDPRTAPTTFAARLAKLRKFSESITQTASDIEGTGEEIFQAFSPVDRGVRSMILSAPVEVERDPESREQYQESFDQLLMLDSTSAESEEQIKSFENSVRPLQTLSRDMKKPVTAIMAGTTKVLEAIVIIHEWASLIRESPVYDS
ncbi:toll/interleukin-1 receptor domain-containing protein [Brevibacterium sp. H602]|uniref:toll/interleukin-1 receptor domain-containing protein n=1 Tax=Brevibacterium sp. H602 TaxID=3444316 RepID=UPI003EC11158